LGLVTEEAIVESAENITIGEWLIEIRNQLPDRRRYDFVAVGLSSAWQSRNKCMHADPQVPMPIRSLDEARLEIASIMRGMSRAHEVFVAQGISLKSKDKLRAKTGTKPTSSAIPASTTNPDRVSVASARERFEDVDIERLAAQLETDG